MAVSTRYTRMKLGIAAAAAAAVIAGTGYLAGQSAGTTANATADQSSPVVASHGTSSIVSTTNANPAPRAAAPAKKSRGS